MKIKQFINLLLLMVLLAIPVTLLLLPADFFDKGESICLSVVFFDKNCYACGMTRAIQHLLHMDISSAYFYNKLSFIVLPLLCISYFKTLKRLISKFFI